MERTNRARWVVVCALLCVAGMTGCAAEVMDASAIDDTDETSDELRSSLPIPPPTCSGDEAPRRTHRFADTASHWSGAVVEELAGLGLIDGYSDRTFRPTARITRAEWATMLARALSLPACTAAEERTTLGRFADGSSIPGWARARVCAVVKARIMTGDSRGFGHDRSLTDAELWTTVAQVMELDRACRDARICPRGATLDDREVLRYFAADGGRGLVQSNGSLAWFARNIHLAIRANAYAADRPCSSEDLTGWARRGEAAMAIYQLVGGNRQVLCTPDSRGDTAYDHVRRGGTLTCGSSVQCRGLVRHWENECVPEDEMTVDECFADASGRDRRRAAELCCFDGTTYDWCFEVCGRMEDAWNAGCGLGDEDGTESRIDSCFAVFEAEDARPAARACCELARYGWCS